MKNIDPLIKNNFGENAFQLAALSGSLSVIHKTYKIPGMDLLSKSDDGHHDALSMATFGYSLRAIIYLRILSKQLHIEFNMMKAILIRGEPDVLAALSEPLQKLIKQEKYKDILGLFEEMEDKPAFRMRR